MTTALLAICCGALWSACLQSPWQMQYVCARCTCVADAGRQMDVHQRWQDHIVVVQPVVCTMLRSPRAINHSQVPSDHRTARQGSLDICWDDRRAAPLACRQTGREQEAGRGGRARGFSLHARAALPCPSPLSLLPQSRKDRQIPSGQGAVSGAFGCFVKIC